MNAGRSRAVVAGVVAAALAIVVVVVVLMTGGDDEPETGAAEAGESRPAAATDRPTGGAASGGGSTANVPAGAPFNAQDVLFARRMAAYQKQAIELAGIAAARGAKPEVTSLAKRIEGEQKAQHATVTARLRSWDEPKAVLAEEDTVELPGMFPADDVRALATMPATDLDWMFLTMMTEHHLGAVTAAEQERKHGKDAAAVALAGQIATGYREQIATMRALHGSS